MIVNPEGRSDRRRAHALVCDSRRTQMMAELDGVETAEPPVWIVVPASIPPGVLESVSAATSHSALVTGPTSLAARRRVNADGSARRGPRSSRLIGLSGSGLAQGNELTSQSTAGQALVGASAGRL